MRTRILCPAKLNLSLIVERPDATGYHPIRTVFQAIQLFDELILDSQATATTIEVEGMALPPENTLTKTLRLVGEALLVPPLKITLKKQIPAESGLGGGSSDAAGLLRGLDPCLAAPIPEQLKFEIAVAVGADVPFFLVGGRALGEGYGERLTPLLDPPETWFALARPGVGVSTAQAYAALDALDYPRATDAPLGVNDFERVAPCESTDLIERLQALGASRVMLSGSGSAVFGEFESEGQAALAAGVLAREGAVWTAVAASLTRRTNLVETL